jgi:hypothetical protein
MFVLSGDHDSFWLNGRAIKIMTILGFLSQIWEMQRMQFRIFLVRCLGRQEPEGGVVLGLRHD